MIDLEKLSPMMRHYLTVKEQNKDCIVLFRLGDFYEMFFEDAELVSKLLDLTLTGRDCGLAERAPMCGVPYHAVDGYVAKLVDKGYRVAICEQLTVPGEGKGLLERGVVRIITPGTVTEESMLVETQNNYIASVVTDGETAGIAWADVTTGEFNIAEFNVDQKLSALEDILVTIRPKEIIASEQAYMMSASLNALKAGEIPAFRNYYDWAYEYNNARKSLLKQLNALSLEGYEAEDKRFAVSAAGALTEYLQETQKRTLAHINRINLIRNDSFMVLDANTRRNLEMTETIRDRKKKGSLLWLMDNTCTNMGARLIRKWIEQPLIDAEAINLRLNAVEELLLNTEARNSIRESAAGVRDLERLAGKVSYGSVNPRDCISISESLKKLPGFKAAMKGLKANRLTALYRSIDPLEKLGKLLDTAIAPDAPALMKDGGYIRAGYNEELDELRDIKQNGEKWIAEIEAAEKEATGIKGLKVGFNRVFGYYIEVSRSFVDKVPYRYVRKQTLSTGERYITEDLKKIEEKILNSEFRSMELESRLFNEIRDFLSQNIAPLQLTAAAVAECDVLCSYAETAENRKYCKPVVGGKSTALKIIEGRHPVVEALLNTNEYVSNDTLLDNKDNSTMIITGPNMAGKSTYMRQVALIALMAHTGSFVPAKSAEIPVIDRIFTRVGASDDVAFGQSTFMVEMLETAQILNNATEKSLLIMDEIGRGTSTHDGLSIAWAVMEYINSRVRAKTMFATHYHELTELEGTLPGVKNYRILVNEHSGRVVFLHKIVRGGTNKSFGIEVASLAGVPKEVTERAKQIAKALEAHDINKDSNSIMLGAIGLKESNLKQLSFVAENKETEIIRTLRDINIDSCSPMQAFMILQELIGKAKK